MTNDEIDRRLRALAEALPYRYEQLISTGRYTKQDAELELLNMQLLGITAMLGEIAKRLPTLKKDDE